MRRIAPSQAQILDWVQERWPNKVTPAWRALKLAEEAGEVAGAVIKSAEDVGGKTEADIAQETAQTVICAMALAESVGFDLADTIDAEWERCGTRVWDPSVGPDGVGSKGRD